MVPVDTLLVSQQDCPNSRKSWDTEDLLLLMCLSLSVLSAFKLPETSTLLRLSGIAVATAVPKLFRCVSGWQQGCLCPSQVMATPDKRIPPHGLPLSLSLYLCLSRSRALLCHCQRDVLSLFALLCRETYQNCLTNQSISAPLP